MGFRRYERLGMEISVGLAIAFIFPCYVFFSVSRKKEGIICLILQLTFLLAPDCHYLGDLECVYIPQTGDFKAFF